VTKKASVRLSANFERNLADIEDFLVQADAPQAYDALLDELLVTVIPNLERFPGMGRAFLAGASGSVETANSSAALRAKLLALTPDPDALREYILADYLVLYAQIGGNLYLLAIKHQRQLSFDFESHWGAASSLP
jgi:plasmid stabilization system protein ParE